MASGPRPSKRPRLDDPGLGVRDEGHEVRDAEVAAGRGHDREGLELEPDRRRWRRPRPAACAAKAAGAATAGVSPLPKAIAPSTSWCCGVTAARRRHDLDRPLAASSTSARSTPCRRTPGSAARRAACATPGARSAADGQLHADRELVLEDEQRLRQALLREVDRLREHDLHAGDAGGRLELQLGRDERGIARLVRLDVQALGQRHLERGLDVVPARTRSLSAIGYDLDRDAPQLGRGGQPRWPTSNASAVNHRRKAEAERSKSCHYVLDSIPWESRAVSRSGERELSDFDAWPRPVSARRRRAYQPAGKSDTVARTISARPSAPRA